MNKLWISYAHVDNERLAIDFVDQELTKLGLEIKRDRWNIQAGQHYWPQIADNILDPAKSDAWLLFATQAAISSPACQEELYTALERALDRRGKHYPFLALFQSSIPRDQIPVFIRTRWYVTQDDPGWRERIVAAVENRDAVLTRPTIAPYYLTVHRRGSGYDIEVAPVAGPWSPIFAAVPLEEQDSVGMRLAFGPPPGGLPGVYGSDLGSGMDGPSGDGKWYVFVSSKQATPSQCYYISCKRMPSILRFGAHRREEYQVAFT